MPPERSSEDTEQYCAPIIDWDSLEVPLDAAGDIEADEDGGIGAIAAAAEETGAEFQVHLTADREAGDDVVLHAAAAAEHRRDTVVVRTGEEHEREAATDFRIRAQPLMPRGKLELHARDHLDLLA